MRYLAALLGLLVACGWGADPLPPTVIPGALPTASATPLPPEATATQEPIATPEPTLPAPATATQAPTAIPTRVPTATRTPLPTSTPTVEPTPTQPEQMVVLHNKARAAAGVGPLQDDRELQAVAEARALDMAVRGYFAHVSPQGQSAFTLLAQLGYVYRAAGENIGRTNYKGQQRVALMMMGWLASPGHRENMLEPRYTHIGIGAAPGANGFTYYVVVFTSR